MARQKPMATFRSLSGLFTLAFVAALVVLALLGNYGLPDTVLGTTLGVGVVVAFAVAGVSERTMRPAEFHTAGGGLSATVNGIATAAAFLSAGALFGLAAAVFSDYRAGIAITLGWSLGFLLLAVLIAPYLRRSGTFGVADFLAFRFANRGVRLTAAVIVVLVLVPALAAAVATGTLVTARLFALSMHTATVVVVLLILSGTVLGGMRAVTLTALAQYIVMAIAIVVPVAIVSTIAYSLPVPQIAAGLAFHEATALAASSGDLARPLASRFLPLVPDDAFQFVAVAVALATGVAALPHLLMRCATVDGAHATRRSIGWALVFVLIVALAVPAYATFAKLALLRDLVGTAITDLPAWLLALGRHGQVALCGADASSVAAVTQACAGHGTADMVAAPDLAVSGDILVLSWPDIVDLPYVVTALIAVGALAAALAAANAIALAIAEALGHDLYGQLVDTKASAGRRLIVTRLLLAATVLVAAWLGLRHGTDIFPLAAATLSLSAGGLFPALFLAVWWRRANGPGAIAGMLAGFAVTAAITVGARYPGLLPVDAQGSGLSALSAALVGLPVGFVVAILVSLATPAPSPEQEAAIDTIRRSANVLAAADI